MKSLFKVFSIGLLSTALLFFIACNDDNESSIPSNNPEVITKVILKFTPVNGGQTLFFNASGPQPSNVKAQDEIMLTNSTDYNLDIQFINDQVNPEVDVTPEIIEEDDEHQVFFAWNTGLFLSPSGTGNILTGSPSGDENGPVNYNQNERDENGLNVGISGTVWSTIPGEGNGKFRVLLMHQSRGFKNAFSNSSSGEVAVDVTFNVSINF